MSITYESLGMAGRGWGMGVGEDFLEEVLPSPPTRLRRFMKGLDSYKTFEEL